jgi:type IV pilus assembly protein PilC
MLGAGLTLSRALSVIQRQSKNKYLKTDIDQLQVGVKSGSAFHETLAQFPNVFSKLFVAMTKAGEESGKLSETLAVVAKQMDTSNTLNEKGEGSDDLSLHHPDRHRIIGILMLMFVVPTLSATFKSLGVQLPLSTRIIVGASDFMAHHAIIVIVGSSLPLSWDSSLLFAANAARLRSLCHSAAFARRGRSGSRNVQCPRGAHAFFAPILRCPDADGHQHCR